MTVGIDEEEEESEEEILLYKGKKTLEKYLKKIKGREERQKGFIAPDP